MRSFVRIGAAVALACAGAVVAIGSSTAGAEQVTQEFEFTGEAQEFVVPAGVCSLTVDAFGAAGGVGTDSVEDAGLGGLGGRATATIAVTPGEALVVLVGEEGHDGITAQAMSADRVEGAEADVAPTGLPADSAGGFNGGGDGGGFGSENFGDGGAGGGGASDVRQGGSGLEHRVVVAGGGGGGGGDAGDEEQDPGDSNGGGGGGATGEDGFASSGDTPPGLGGSQTAGGAAGDIDPSATDGELGQGGDGGRGNDSDDGGGGGGGGYYGGGGGAGAIFDGTNNGGGGGGGSGFGPAGVAFETGVQEGDGFVSITYDPALQTCPIVVEPRFTG